MLIAQEDFINILDSLKIDIDSLKNINYKYIKIENITSISYLPNNKINIVKSKGLDFYNNNYRITIGFGRFLTNIIPDISARKVQQHVYYFKVIYKLRNNLVSFKIVKGEDIKKWYNEKNTIQLGSLGNSCMRHEQFQYKIDFYSRNSDVCSMIILKDDEKSNKIIGRALIWKTDKGLYMDRPYTSYEEDFLIFEAYCISENILYYGKVMNDKIKLKVKIKEKKYFKPLPGKYPYMDTFKFYYFRHGLLTNYNRGIFYRYVALLNIF